MLVCEHWRAVILSTSTFWRKVNLDRCMGWTNLCLTRSAPASIHVIAGLYSVCPVEVLHPHAHRFQTLRLDAAQPESPHSKTALRSLFEDRMPLLEHFYLNLLRPEAYFEAHLTSRRLPRLRTLALCGTIAPQDMSLFAQVRALSLSFCSHNLSFDAFLDTLAVSFQLEELTLKGTLHFPSAEWVNVDPGPVSRRPLISLPRLRKLALGDHGILRTSRFLAHLYIPPSAVLSIEGDYGTEKSDAGAVHMITAMLPPNRSETLPILAIATELDMTIRDDEYQICAIPYRARLLSRRSPHARFALLTYDSDDHDWDPFMPEGLADLVECFGRSPIRRLAVTGQYTYGTMDAWEKVFRTFAHLEELSICGDSDFLVSNVFRGLHAASIAQPDAPVVCHNLSHLEVAGSGLGETYEAMQECLRYRGDRGVMLQVLDLKGLDDEDDSIPQVRLAFVKDMSTAVECIQMPGHRGETDGEQRI